MLTKHKKVINGCEVEVLFETYLESGEVYLQHIGVVAKWRLGGHKSIEKWNRQLEKRGWTMNQITEALENGKPFEAENLVNKGNKATRYVHSEEVSYTFLGSVREMMSETPF